MVYVCCGNPERRYWDTLKNSEKLIFSLAQHPLTKDEVLKLTDESSFEYLLQNGLLKIENSLVTINFCFIPWEDIQRLRKIGIEYGTKLADEISRLEWIHTYLKNLRASARVDMKLIRFAVIGAYALDLQFLNIINASKDRDFIPYAREVREGLRDMVKDFYWGCHSTAIDGYNFYSFGNHSGIRYAFPDIIWRGDASENDAISLARALERFYNENIENKVLKKYGYSNALFLDKEDEKLAWHIAERIAKEAKSIVDSFEIDTHLKSLKASRWARYEDIFIEAWHWIFGWANNMLVNGGYFCEPESVDGWGKYIKWISI